jgi:hypothetical protein
MDREMLMVRWRRKGVVVKVYFTGNTKKSAVSDKRVYRISRKFIGIAISLADKI